MTKTGFDGLNKDSKEIKMYPTAVKTMEYKFDIK